MAIKRISANLLGGNAVTAAKIAGGAISAADIANNSITAAKLSTSTFAIDSLTVNTSDLVVDTANNRVGIGTTSPERALHIVGGLHLENNYKISWDQADGTLRNAIYVDSGDDMIIGDTNFDDIYFSTGQKTKTVVIKQTTGNVGIGTDSPNAKLDIESDSNPTIRLTNSKNWIAPETGTIGTLEWYTTDTSGVGARVLSFIKSENLAGSTVPEGALTFGTAVGGGSGTAAAERMRIDPSGNVGIGTNNPGAPLDLETAGNTIDGTYYSTFTINNTGTSTYSRIRFDRSGVAKWGLQLKDDDTFTISNLFTNGTSASPDDNCFVITNQSYIGIGTNSPVSPLTTSISAGAAGSLNNQISLTHDSATTEYHIKTIRDTATDNPDGIAFVNDTVEQMRIQGDGYGGIHASIGTTEYGPSNGGIGVTLKLSSDTVKVDSAVVLEADNGEFTLYSYNNKFHISETKTSGTFKYLATWDNNGNMATGTVPTTTPLATFHVNMGDNPSGSDEGAVMRAVATNASFGNSNAMLGLNCARSGDSGYRFIQCNSNTTTSVTDAEFVLYGNGNANADGSWSGSGADYAEFFESTDGTAIPRGTSVVIDNGKVRAATSEDDVSNIMGVARPKEEGRNSMIIGNTAWNFWTNKYLQDDFGCYIMEEFTTTYWVDEDTVHHEYATDYIPEDVIVPENAQIRTHEDSGKVLTRRKLNPAWSESDVYVPRLERDEWIIVGLMGQVQILKGQPVNDRWIKMRDISDTVEEWYIR